MADVVAPPSGTLTTAPGAAALAALEGKHIREICGNGYTSDDDNHCAHFVSHVMGFSFGATCRTMTRGSAAAACIRVHELFAMCPAVGEWSSLATTACLVFVTDRSNVDLRRKRMSNVPRKHVGIYLSGTVWHYSNAQAKVVTQVPDAFAHHYPGPRIALFWGTFPP